ncbi:unnamed protein product [Rhodiola kirilowii]
MADAMRIKPLDGTSDFNMWKMKMKASLVKEKCYKAVTEEWIIPTFDQQKTDMKELAYSEIMMRLTDDVARKVMHHTEPKTLWDELEKIYLVKSLPNRISLQTKLFTFKMNVFMSLQENLDIFLKLTQALKKCKDEHLCVILLKSLPSQFDILKDVIQFASDELTVSKIIEDVTQQNDSLKVFKTKNGSKIEVKSEVMIFKGKNKCNYCGKLGHYASSYYKRMENKKNKGNKDYQSGQSNICEKDPQYHNELLLMSDGHGSDSWILDSGCTMHATPHHTSISSVL